MPLFSSQPLYMMQPVLTNKATKSWPYNH